MYLLKREFLHSVSKNKRNSHSTMYLLKLRYVHSLLSRHPHSHSTMYLLKPEASIEQGGTRYRFTFHHVSIKTQ